MKELFTFNIKKEMDRLFLFQAFSLFLGSKLLSKYLNSAFSFSSDNMLLLLIVLFFVMGVVYYLYEEKLFYDFCSLLKGRQYGMLLGLMASACGFDLSVVSGCVSF